MLYFKHNVSFLASNFPLHIHMQKKITRSSRNRNTCVILIFFPSTLKEFWFQKKTDKKQFHLYQLSKRDPWELFFWKLKSSWRVHEEFMKILQSSRSFLQLKKTVFLNLDTLLILHFKLHCFPTRTDYQTPSNLVNQICGEKKGTDEFFAFFQEKKRSKNWQIKAQWKELPDKVFSATHWWSNHWAVSDRTFNPKLWLL